MKILSDPDSERGLLSGLIKYGSFSYHSIVDVGLSDSSFTIDSHSVIFKCLDNIFKNQDNIKPDLPLIYSSAVEIGLRGWFLKNDEVEYLNAIMEQYVEENNIRVFAIKIKKLEIGRLINERLKKAENDTLEISGNESINDIFGIIERSILDCGKFLSSHEKSATKLSDGLEEYFDDLEKNPIEQIGISTNFPLYDAAIGGGLRSGGVNVVGARSKMGKSTLCLNIGKNIAGLRIPVLYLDTEMSKESNWNRLISCISEVNNKEIETGQYIKFQNDINKVQKAIQTVKNLPIYHESIAGESLESQISSIKRWIITEVGLKKNGQAKECVVIYDYLKLMNEEQGKGYQEYQMLGFIMTSLVNLAQKYNFPILAAVQLNRDGISKEDSSSISQSDRIVWYCSSLAIFKAKDSEEMQMDGYENGNRKLIVTEARFGPGLLEGDYINCNFNKSISKITEGKTKFEIRREQKQNKINLLEDTESNDNGEKVQF